MADELETGTYTIPAPRSDEDAASAYEIVAVEQEAASNNQWMDDLIANDGQPSPVGPDGNPAPKNPTAPAEQANSGATEENSGEGRSFGDVAKAAASDFGLGMVEGTSQIIGGMADAFDEAGQFIGEATGIGGFQIMDDDGNFSPEYLSWKEWSDQEKQDSLTGFFKTDPAESGTGAMIRATSQFLIGFIPAMKGAKLLKAGKVTSVMVSGAIADAVVFDPHEERLSTFLNEIPFLEPYVSDYLADNDPENESSWEGRLKNAVEGAGLGLAADGASALFKSFKYYKAQRNAANQFAPDTPGAQAEAARDAVKEAARDEISIDVTDEELAPLGNPDGNVIEYEAKSVAKQRLKEARVRADADGLTLSPDELAAASGRKVYINHARIKSDEDVKTAIQTLADAEQKAIDGKRGGKTVTNEETVRASSQEYRDMNDLLGREPGPMTAAQSVAARKLLTASGEQILELARKAQAADASKVDVYNFRRAMSVHYALQSEVVAARTEVARALQAWAIPVGSSKARTQAITDLIMEGGGAGDLQSMAKAVVNVGDNPTGLNVIARDLGRGRFGKAAYQIWINGLLSSPKTHMVNITSNALVALWALPEKLMASGISKAFYDGEIATGEVAAQAYGMVKGVRDGVGLIYHGNKAEDVEGLGDVFDAFGKMEIHNNAVSAEAFGLNAEGAFGRGIDMLGKVTNMPGSLLQAEDKFFKSIGYRMELQSLAYRQATSEGLEGEEMASRITDILLDPPDHLKADALDQAAIATFTNPLGKTGRAFQEAVRKIPGAKVVVPFIRTPTNIVKYTFARTPLAVMSGKVRSEIKAGGAKAAQAYARIATGSMVMLAVADMTSEGTITGRGPTDPNLRRLKMDTGWMPYSIKVGDRWVGYSRADPIGMIIGLGADMTEITANVNSEESEMLVTAGVLALANNMASKTYMRGVYDFIGAIDPNNPTNSPERYIGDFASSMMPYSSFLRNSAGAIDPVIRDSSGLVRGEDGKVDEVATFFEETLNGFRKQIPGLSDSLPPRRDLYGEIITRESGLGVGYDFLSPLASRVDDPDVVTQAFLDNRVSISNAPKSINGVELTPEQYSDFVEMAGKPMKTFLNSAVTSPGFKALSEGPDGMKAEFLRDAINNFRDIARVKMLQDNPQLRELVFLKQMERAKSLQGDN